MKVIQYGYSRTGTTLVCRVLYRLLKIGKGDILIKTHFYMPEEMRNNLTVVSVRDIRDALISHYRSNYEPHYGRPPPLPVQKGELDEMIRGIVQYLDQNFWPTISLGRCLVLKYEDFYLDIDGLIRRLCQELRIAYPDNADQIAEECSISRVRQLTASLKSFKEVGTEGLHGNHINTPGPGFWKSAFAPDYHYHLTYMFRQFLDHYGYDTSAVTETNRAPQTNQ